MHWATAQAAIRLAETAIESNVADVRVAAVSADGAATAWADSKTGIKTAPETGIGSADSRRDGGVPYSFLDQVAWSLAIHRLHWLRHLPAPRTAAEHRVDQRIRAAGWSAPA
jgi:hypothetical protein